MNPYWINANGLRVAIVPRPRGWDWLRDDINSLPAAGINVLVSALTPPEIDELGLAAEGDHCSSVGMEFLNFPIEDRSVLSSPASFHEALNSLNSFVSKGKSVAVHCRVGIGRSSIIVSLSASSRRAFCGGSFGRNPGSQRLFGAGYRGKGTLDSAV